MRRAGIIARMSGGRPPAGDWPLSISSNGRYLQTPTGAPFFPVIDTAWCAITQLTTAQMDTYVADCVTRKINGVIVELIESTFSDNAPNTIDSLAPFSPAGNFGSPQSAYFTRADYFIQKCKDNGIVVFLWPLYVGLQEGGGQGWSAEFDAESTADRQSWGTFLVDRYEPFGNIVWIHGGDGTVSSFTNINHYIDNIVSGWSGSIHGYHAARNTPGFTAAGAQSWYNLHSVYTDGTGTASPTKTEYDRTPARPVFLVEDYYEGDGTGTADSVIVACWQALCSGALAGVAYGNHDIWTFGGPGFDANFAAHYSDTGRTRLQYIRDLIDLYSWEKLVPTTDTSLVTTALGSGASRIAPAKASDSTFAWIFSPGANFTLNRATFSGAHSNIRIRSYTVNTGAFSTISASVATTGTQAITVSGNQVIVVDGA